MQKLREINFGDCLLKTKGAMILADAIQDMHVDLEVLNLEANEIGPDGGIIVAQSMHNKTKLKNLFLDCNQFGQEARDQISELLIKYDKLEAVGPLDEDDSEGEEEEEDDENGDEEDDEYEDVEDGEEDYEDGDGECVFYLNYNMNRDYQLRTVQTLIPFPMSQNVHTFYFKIE